MLGRKSERDRQATVLAKRVEAMEAAHSALQRERREEEGEWGTQRTALHRTMRARGGHGRA